MAPFLCTDSFDVYISGIWSNAEERQSWLIPILELVLHPKMYIFERFISGIMQSCSKTKFCSVTFYSSDSITLCRDHFKSGGIVGFPESVLHNKNTGVHLDHY